MDLGKIYPKRDNWTHKGRQGYVLVIAGSKKYPGSAIFNAFSALRAGADIACCLGPEKVVGKASQFLPDIIILPLPGDVLRKKHLPFIFKKMDRFNSLVLGCGLERSLESFQMILEIIERSSLPMVVDAEGIRALAERKEVLKGKKIILTPHSKEFEILTKEKISFDVEERKRKVEEWARKLETVILLKGHIDVISNGKETFLNESGSPFMTKGGLGDILSGILGAILARGVEPFAAAKAGAFILGKAGEMASQIYEEGLLASDIFNFIPQAIKKYGGEHFGD